MAVQWDKLESIAYPLLLTHRTRTLERFRMSVNVARGMDMGCPPPRRPVGALRCPVLLRVGEGGGSGLAHCFVGAWRLVDLDLPAASIGDCYYYRLRRLHLTGVSLGGRFVEQVRLRLPDRKTGKACEPVVRSNPVLGPTSFCCASSPDLVSPVVDARYELVWIDSVMFRRGLLIPIPIAINFGRNIDLIKRGTFLALDIHDLGMAIVPIYPNPIKIGYVLGYFVGSNAIPDG
uniref:Uncharacterized protein n=1 Tax=Oryza barthii TaxID=65489 RepID=A0A0D3EPB3_9ORYZ